MRKREWPKPPEVPDGFLYNPIGLPREFGLPPLGALVACEFVQFIAAESMKNWNEEEQNGNDCGMPRWDKDPTYNLRRKPVSSRN